MFEVISLFNFRQYLLVSRGSTWLDNNNSGNCGLDLHLTIFFTLVGVLRSFGFGCWVFGGFSTQLLVDCLLLKCEQRCFFLIRCVVVLQGWHSLEESPCYLQDMLLLVVDFNSEVVVLRYELSKRGFIIKAKVRYRVLWTPAKHCIGSYS